MLAVTDVREWIGEYAPQWLLTLEDGRGVWVSWPGDTIFCKLSETPFRELWAMEFGRQDNQILAVYLPEEREKTWTVCQKHLQRKLTFDGSVVNGPRDP